jgi:hypothetical protein
MSGVQKYLLVECDGSMLFINNQPGCCLISIYVLVPAAWISLMSSMVGWYRFGSQSVDESKNGSLSQSVLKLTHGEIGLCSVALCGVGQWRQWRTIKNQFRHRRHGKITTESLIKCPSLGRYRCAFLMCSLSLLS